MIRSRCVFVSTIIFLLLAVICLQMLVNHCPTCSFYWLGAILVTVVGFGGLAGIAMFTITLWRTQRLWHLCRLDGHVL